MRLWMTAALAIAVSSLSFIAQPIAEASNVVQDGDFEQADISASPGSADYTFGPTTPFDNSWSIVSGTAGIDTDNKFIYAGHKSLYLDPDSRTTIRQNLSTSVGSIYTLTFFADDNGFDPLTVDFGNIEVGPFLVTQNGYPNPGILSNSTDFTEYTFNLPATSTTTALEFSAPDNSSPGVELDNISVSALGSDPAPEPSTLFALGFMILATAASVAYRKHI